MMGRRVGAWMAVALGMGLILPGSAEAQIRIHVDWEWNSDGRTGGRVYADGRYGYRIPRIGVVRYQPVRYIRVHGVRIPRGFRPARGMCRLWYPGVAPGRQPRPFRCEALRGRFHPDVLVVTWRGVLRPVWGRYDRVRYASVGGLDYRWLGERRAWDDRYDGYDRYEREDRRERGDRYGRWDGDRWEERDGNDWWDDDDDRQDDRGEWRDGRNGRRNGRDNARGRRPANGRGRGG